MIAASPPALMSESVLLASVRELAKLTGWLCYHTHDSRRSEPGYPDLTLLRDGRLLVAELKTATGKLTPAQWHWITQFRKAGIETHIWRPNDWFDQTILKTLTKENTK